MNVINSKVWDEKDRTSYYRIKGFPFVFLLYLLRQERLDYEEV